MADREIVGAGKTSKPNANGLSRVSDAHDAYGELLGRQDRGIPRLIHRIWLDQILPEPFKLWGDAWEELNPDWVLMQWGDSAALKDIPFLRPDLLARAKEIIPNDWRRFQADVLRLELLYLYGGVYVDMDVEPHLPIDPFLSGRRGVLVARSPNATATGYHAITNCFMAAEPGHPYIKALIDNLDEAIERNRGKHLAQMIGPWHLDRTYTPDAFPDVEVLEWSEVATWMTHYWNNQRRKRGEGIA